MLGEKKEKGKKVLLSRALNSHHLTLSVYLYSQKGRICFKTSANSITSPPKRCYLPHYGEGRSWSDDLIGKIETNSLESWLPVPFSYRYIIHSWLFFRKKEKRRLKLTHYDNAQVS